MKDDRNSIDQMWMDIAKTVCENRSTCKSGRLVGAVIVSQNGRILSTGYNGVPSKMPHPTECIRRKLGCASGEQLHLCGCQHAESNALINAARNGVSIEGAVMYVTTSPCGDCFGKILNAGISEVVYDEPYGNISKIEQMSEMTGVALRKMNKFILEDL